MAKKHISLANFFKSPSETFLDISKAAITYTNIEYLDRLIGKGADPYFQDVKDPKRRFPIHYAAKNGNYVLLDYLVKLNIDSSTCVVNIENKNTIKKSTHRQETPQERDARSHVTAIDNSGRTALHYAAKSNCEDKNEENYVKCIQILMGAVEVNRPDKEGFTAITYAAYRRHKRRVEALLKHSHIINLDTSTAHDGATARFAITRFYPDMYEDVPVEFQRNINNGFSMQTQLLKSLINGTLPVFKELLQTRPVNPNYIYKEPYYATILEIACSMDNRTEFVRELLRNKYDPNIRNSIHEKPLLFLSLEGGKADVLKSLMENSNIDMLVLDKYGHNALHYAIENQGLAPKRTEGHRACMNELLKYFTQKSDKGTNTTNSRQGSRVIDINTTDNAGDTALHLAARYGDNETVLSLLRRGANTTIRNGSGVAALHSIDPETLEEFLDTQITSFESSIHDKHCCLMFNYTFMINETNVDGSVATNLTRESAGLTILQLLYEKEHMRKLIKHPIIRSFLHMSWKMVRFYFYVNLILYILFVALLTPYLLFINCDEYIKKDFWYQEVLCNELDIYTYLLAGIAFLLVIRELIQFIRNPGKYLTDLENYIELFVFLYVIMVTALDFLNYELPGGESKEAVYKYLPAVVILLAWAELILLIGRLPILSIQLEMLRKVTITFLQYMPWYSLMIIAFSLSFYALFAEEKITDTMDVSGTVNQNMKLNGSVTDMKNPFQNPLTAIFKTVIMMTGEFDMSPALFNDVPVVSNLVFLIFVLLVSIVMLNLLSGLAVGDTSAIRNDAKMLSLVYIAKLVVLMDKFHKGLDMFNTLRNREDYYPLNFRKEIFVYPNHSGGKSITDLEFKFHMEKEVVKDAVQIVSNRIKRQHRIQIAEQRRDSLLGTSNIGPMDVSTKLETFEKRLTNIEVTLKVIMQLLTPERRIGETIYPKV